MEKEKLIKCTENEVECTSKLLHQRYSSIIGESRSVELRKIHKKLHFLLDKLKNNTFEVAIVGLEKSGKSTFANAFMGCDILPTKDARCTYTATRICYGTDDKAEVKFYSTNEFNEGFQQKLLALGVEIDDSLDWREWSLEKLDACVSELDLNSDRKNVLNDLKEIIENSSSLSEYLGRDIMVIDGEDLEFDIKGYIESPSKALAVKEIVIFSSRLVEMKNAVLYDVPGFDSPTQLHKDQTKAWMKRGDAVILIVNADRPSFNDSLVHFFEDIDKDDDSISIGEKLFVFANRADVASQLDDNMKKIRDELSKYRIMPETALSANVIAGSAKARLDIKNGDGEQILAILRSKGIEDDGIDRIRKMLSTYNDTIRVQVMQRRMQNAHAQVIDILNIICDENKISDGDTITIELDNILDLFKKESCEIIVQELSSYRDDLKKATQENLPITHRIRETVIQKIIPFEWQITDDEIRRKRNAEWMETGTLLTSEIDVRQEKFREMYDKFINDFVSLAVEEYKESEEAIVEIFANGLSVTPIHPHYDELISDISDYVHKKCYSTAPDGYYTSLIRRYSGCLFKTLISTPFAFESRYKAFDQDRKNFYSLSLFDNEIDDTIKPSNQPMHGQILFHTNITELTDNDSDDKAPLRNVILLAENKLNQVIPVHSETYKLIDEFMQKYDETAFRMILSEIRTFSNDNSEGIPLFALNPNPAFEELNSKLKAALSSQNTSDKTFDSLSEQTYHNFFWNYNKTVQSIKEEFISDVLILKNILDKQVMNAVSIEIPFLDLVDQNILSLREGLATDFNVFINERKNLILEDKYRSYNDEMERKRKQQEILKEIEMIFDSES